ncbi:NAD(+) kinase [Flavobacteriaceae bacterium UJ101]|nr:NAD(+) kinase [Flavobacteriaceae bacterium UJ101]
MKIAIYGHKINSETIEYFNRIIKVASDFDATIYFEENTLVSCQKIEGFEKSSFHTFNHYRNLPSDTQLFFAFGGDGTMLRAQTFIQDYDIPLVGINMGRLGFLAYFNTEDFTKSCIQRLLNGDFEVDERSLLRVDYINQENPENNFALNELAITRKETTSMIVVDVYINNEKLNSYWADGLIIATPTGSTGYSLSCGGPIIDPVTDNIVITPIAPHNLFVRPFIISDKDVIRLKIDSREDDYLLTLDSRIDSLSVNVELEVKKASFTTKIVKFNKHSYLQALKEKLYWGIDQRNT